MYLNLNLTIGLKEEDYRMFETDGIIVGAHYKSKHGSKIRVLEVTDDDVMYQYLHIPLAIKTYTTSKWYFHYIFEFDNVPSSIETVKKPKSDKEFFI